MGGRSFPPRQTTLDWARFVGSSLITVPLSSKLLVVGFFAEQDVTVRRTIGKYWVQGDNTGAQELQVGAIGAMVVSDLAFTAGAASIPGPVTEASDDVWALWQPFMQTNEKAADAGIGFNSNGPFEFDSKAQRKLPEGTTYVIMVENASGTFGLEIVLAVSVLVSH